MKLNWAVYNWIGSLADVYSKVQCTSNQYNCTPTCTNQYKPVSCQQTVQCTGHMALLSSYGLRQSCLEYSFIIPSEREWPMDSNLFINPIPDEWNLSAIFTLFVALFSIWSRSDQNRVKLTYFIPFYVKQFKHAESAVVEG